MSDQDVAINAEFIRKTAQESLSHIGSFRQVKLENSKLKSTITNLNHRIQNLERESNVLPERRHIPVSLVSVLRKER